MTVMNQSADVDNLQLRSRRVIDNRRNLLYSLTCRRLVLRFTRPKASAYLHSPTAILASRRPLSAPVPTPPADRLSRHRGRISGITRRLFTEYAMSALIDDRAAPYRRQVRASGGCNLRLLDYAQRPQFSTPIIISLRSDDIGAWMSMYLLVVPIDTISWRTLSLRRVVIKSTCIVSTSQFESGYYRVVGLGVHL